VYLVGLFSTDPNSDKDWDSMTQAICINCGKIHFGALTPCKSCGYRPETGWEIGVSMVHSDHYQSQDTLSRYSQMIQRRYDEGDLAYESFNEQAEELIRSFVDEPSDRDIFTLQKYARDTFFRKQMNWHFIGPDGYETQVVQRGKDMPKREYDAFRKILGADAFYIRLYEDGQRKELQIEKPIWYAVKDIFRLIERKAKKEDRFIELLTLRSRRYTYDYLAEKGFHLELENQKPKPPSHSPNKKKRLERAAKIRKQMHQVLNNPNSEPRQITQAKRTLLMVDGFMKAKRK
jgi:hypothetical protein